MADSQILAIDIGGSKLLTALVDVHEITLCKGAEDVNPTLAQGENRKRIEREVLSTGFRPSLSALHSSDQGVSTGLNNKNADVVPTTRSQETTFGSKRKKAVLSGISKRLLYKTSQKADILREIDKAIGETFRQTGKDWINISQIGLTIPGLADGKRGDWIFAPFSGIADFPIASILSQKYDREVFADNDVNACAWGEKIFGVCQDIDDFLWITISNGIGGGLVLNGQIYPGTFGGAAEFGHFNIVENGNLCGCGNRGCLEAHAAGPAIARRFRTILDNRANELIRFAAASGQKEFEDQTDLDISAASIAQAAYNGYELAIQVFNETGHYLGRAAAFAANLINPSKIIIGGGVSGAFDLFQPEMERTFWSQVIGTANKNVKIEKTGLGYEAGLFGAASLIYQKRD
ncbi:MAG: ROK family protein [Planctomycetia bacterium]|nr:ROK family protein [Planctomycetia bacterium]